MGRRCLAVFVIGSFILSAGLPAPAAPPRATTQPATQPAAQPTTQPAAADQAERIVVTATRLDTPLREVASSITVITAADIERRGAQWVLDALRDVPGLDIVRTGGPGATGSVFIRGAKSEHTKVLIDGICVNDPISPGGTFDFAHLNVDDIERIEVLRGPQSVLYGSDAIGGVIHIITRRGAGKFGGYVKGEGGSFDTYKVSAAAGASVGWLDFYATLTRTDSGGFSSAGEDYGNHERDPYRNTSFSAKVGLTPRENFEIIFVLRATCAASELDDEGGAGGDDPNHDSYFRSLAARVEGRLTLLDDRWEQKIGLSYVEYNRGTHDDPDAGDITLIRSTYRSRRVKFDWQHDLYLHETNTLTIGVEAEQEQGSSSYHSDGLWGPYTSRFRQRSQCTTGIFVQDKISLADSLFVTVGGRIDRHEKFGTVYTWRVAPAYVLRRTGTTFKAAAGTGFKAPTLFQLYSSYGSEDLQPERSFGWELGVRQRLLGRKLAVEATYFRNRFENLIDYDFATSKYNNIGMARSDGVELSAAYEPSERLRFEGSYTFTRTEDAATQDDLFRRARHKFGASVTCRPTDRLELNAGVSFVGGRDDVDSSVWPARRARLAKYVLWRFGASYKLTGHVTVFGRIENAFNEHYEQIKGYGTPGAAVYAGLKATF